MIIEALEQYLEAVAGYVFDNDKLVTYKWLSKELKVHVNIAKQVLWEFWQRNNAEKDFECTILLIGILKDNGMQVEVVKIKDLTQAKEKYNKVLSEHIYSLQKTLPDLQLLSLADDGDVRYSAIKCLDNNKRSNEELHTLRWGAISKDVCMAQTKPEEKVELTHTSNVTKDVESSKEKEGTKKKNADKKGFENLFGKQKSPPAVSTTEKTGTDKAISKHVPESSKKPAQKGKLNSFFQKATNSKPDKNKVHLESKDKEEKNVPSESPKKEENIRGKKRVRSKDSNNTASKRKRIVIQSDSSSEDSVHEEEMPPSPHRSPPMSPVKACSPPPSQEKFQSGRRRVLKIVDKTYMEDGFLVTKKVHTYESCSDEEVETEEAKKPAPSEPKQDAKEKKNTKQTTLMSFFKKS